MLIPVENDEIKIPAAEESRVGNAMSDNSFIGVPSCFSGGRRMVQNEQDRRPHLTSAGYAMFSPHAVRPKGLP